MTAPVHHRRLKQIVFTIGGTEFQTQITSWNVDPGEKDGDRVYSYGTTSNSNSFVEETDGEPTLELKWVSDWRAGGLDDYLWSNNNVEADFQLDHHPDIAGEHVRWTGRVLLKAPPAGDEARKTEMSEIKLSILGTLGDGLDYERIG